VERGWKDFRVFQQKWGNTSGTSRVDGLFNEIPSFGDGSTDDDGFRIEPVNDRRQSQAQVLGSLLQRFHCFEPPVSSHFDDGGHVNLGVSGRAVRFDVALLQKAFHGRQV